MIRVHFFNVRRWCCNEMYLYTNCLLVHMHLECLTLHLMSNLIVSCSLTEQDRQQAKKAAVKRTSRLRLVYNSTETETSNRNLVRLAPKSDHKFEIRAIRLDVSNHRREESVSAQAGIQSSSIHRP